MSRSRHGEFSETLEAGQRLTMGQLADVVLMNPPTLTKLVDRMVSDGLVHRQVARHDNRQINVLATALGRKRMLQIRQEVEGQDAALLQSLGKPATEDLIELLKEVTYTDMRSSAETSSPENRVEHRT